MSMLEYSKMILSKVSFDARLFQKEFEKALKSLLPSEVQELIAWIRTEFRGQPVLATVGLS